MPQVLCQAVEEGGYISQPINVLTPHTQHRQALGLLKGPHVPLGHVTVHEKVKPETDVKGSFQIFDLNCSTWIQWNESRGYLVPTTTLTRDVPVHRVIWFGRSSKDVLSVKEKRRRTASTCSWQDWKTKEWRMKTSKTWIFWLFSCAGSINLPEGNGQICAVHFLHSPTAANRRKELSHLLSVSPANTPSLSQYLKNRFFSSLF